VVRRLGWRSYHEIRLPIAEVNGILDASGAEPWFKWSIAARASRGEATSAMTWIVTNLDRDKHIFETGCGCAANLIWLGQQGYTNLGGSDVSAEAITAGQKLAALAEVSLNLNRDDSYAPRHPLIPTDLLLAINWTYYLNHFRLDQFLERYKPALQAGSLVIFDMVDSIFNTMPDNEYKTDDWLLPRASRQPSQYIVRMSRDQVIECANNCGFDVLTFLSGTKIPPRFVTVLRRRASEIEEI
jgi:hypothetical protein